jgi:hypothetical protein
MQAISWCIVAGSLVEYVLRFGLIARIRRNILTNQRVNKAGNVGAGLIGSTSLNQVVKIDIGCICRNLIGCIVCTGSIFELDPHSDAGM